MKTHRGVRIEFALLTKNDPAPSRDVAGLLVRAYEYKEVSDYGSNKPDVVTNADAEALIASATEFVHSVESLLA